MQSSVAPARCVLKSGAAQGIADLAAGGGTGACPLLLCRKLKDVGFIAPSTLGKPARLP